MKNFLKKQLCCNGYYGGDCLPPVVNGFAGFIMNPDSLFDNDTATLIDNTVSQHTLLAVMIADTPSAITLRAKLSGPGVADLFSNEQFGPPPNTWVACQFTAASNADFALYNKITYQQGDFLSGQFFDIVEVSVPEGFAGRSTFFEVAGYDDDVPNSFYYLHGRPKLRGAIALGTSQFAFHGPTDVNILVYNVDPGYTFANQATQTGTSAAILDQSFNYGGDPQESTWNVQYSDYTAGYFETCAPEVNLNDGHGHVAQLSNVIGNALLGPGHVVYPAIAWPAFA
jgi:hypothetical protein